jgi:hypothetical protein
MLNLLRHLTGLIASECIHVLSSVYFFMVCSILYEIVLITLHVMHGTKGVFAVHWTHSVFTLMSHFLHF